MYLATEATAAAATVIHGEALAWIVAISVVVLIVRLRFFGQPHQYCKFSVAAASGAAEPSLIDRLTVVPKPFGQKWTSLVARPAAPAVAMPSQ